MYTRDFGPQDAQMNVPESYSGNLFKEEGERFIHNETEEENHERGNIVSTFRSFFDNSFDFKKLPFLKKGFGTEELLIIGIAAFLFFSKDGDRECAIILLLTLILS